MRLTLLSLPVLTTILACGPGQPGETTTDADATTTISGSASEPDVTTTTTTTTGTTTTATATTATATATTEAEPTTGVVTTAPTTDPVETTTTGEPATSTTDVTGTTGGAPDLAFGAQFWSGGLDHLMVRQADLKDDMCLALNFARPGDLGRPELVLPKDWWFQGATLSQGAAGCLDFDGPMPAGIASESISGTGTWDPEPICPPSVDIDVVLTFPQDEPWVPAEVEFVAGGIAVQGC